MAKDYYEILGIERTASQEEVKKAFHRLAHKHHPNKGGDEKKFKEINEAYQILSNQQKRSQYDQFGQVFEGGNAGSGFDPNFFWGNRQNAENIEFDMGDLGEIFGDFFGGGRRRAKDVKKGSDVKIEIEIDLEDALNESKKVISLKKQVVCKRCEGLGAEPGTKVKECFSCRGTGQVQQIRKTVFGSFTQTTICPECGGEGQRPEKPCNVCKGEGRVKGDEEIEIFIPAGVDTNQMIKAQGKGNAGRRNAKSGDLYIRIFVKPHLTFERKGDDLYTVKEISFSQAVLGDEVEVQTLEKGNILLKVPEGTESGKVFRISGKGLPHFGGYGRGGLFIELIVKIPKKLSKKQKELLEKLKEEGI